MRDDPLDITVVDPNEPLGSNYIAVPRPSANGVENVAHSPAPFADEHDPDDERGMSLLTWLTGGLGVVIVAVVAAVNAGPLAAAVVIGGTAAAGGAVYGGYQRIKERRVRGVLNDLGLGDRGKPQEKKNLSKLFGASGSGGRGGSLPKIAKAAASRPAVGLVKGSALPATGKALRGRTGSGGPVVGGSGRAPATKAAVKATKAVKGAAGGGASGGGGKGIGLPKLGLGKGSSSKGGSGKPAGGGSKGGGKGFKLPALGLAKLGGKGRAGAGGGKLAKATGLAGRAGKKATGGVLGKLPGMGGRAAKKAAAGGAVNLARPTKAGGRLAAAKKAATAAKLAASAQPGAAKKAPPGAVNLTKPAKASSAAAKPSKSSVGGIISSGSGGKGLRYAPRKVPTPKTWKQHRQAKRQQRYTMKQVRYAGKLQDRLDRKEAAVQRRRDGYSRDLQRLRRGAAWTGRNVIARPARALGRKLQPAVRKAGDKLWLARKWRPAWWTAAKTGGLRGVTSHFGRGAAVALGAPATPPVAKPACPVPPLVFKPPAPAPARVVAPKPAPAVLFRPSAPAQRSPQPVRAGVTRPSRRTTAPPNRTQASARGSSMSSHHAPTHQLVSRATASVLAAANYEPPNERAPEDLAWYLASLAELDRAAAQSLRHLATYFRSNTPVDQSVYEYLNAVADGCGVVSDRQVQSNATYQNAHQRDLARSRDPRPGESSFNVHEGSSGNPRQMEYARAVRQLQSGS